MGSLTEGSTIQHLGKDIGTSETNNKTRYNGSYLATKSKALDMVSQAELSRGPVHEHWWNLTGPQLASMLEEAGYTMDRQLEILLFYYHWIVC